jgi:ABC-type spermidine/putrescine transport system permease subunit II
VRTFPRQVFDAARLTIPPQAQVLATMIMLIAVIVVVGGTVVANRRAARG